MAEEAPADVTLTQAIDAYRRRFGARALPHLLGWPMERRAELVRRLLQAVEAGRTLATDELWRDGPAGAVL